jgi:hypothetical protein
VWTTRQQVAEVHAEHPRLDGFEQHGAVAAGDGIVIAVTYLGFGLDL